MICIAHLTYDHIEENEMGEACSTLGERRNAYTAMKAVPVVM
jgi:hypothetical protein